MSRAHQTAWPRPSGALLAREARLAGAREIADEELELARLAPLGERALELERGVEVILDRRPCCAP